MFKSKKGLTLIELIITLAIFATLLSLLGAFFIAGLDSYKTSSEMLTSQSNVRGVMFELSSKLREASLDEITINELHSEIDINGVVYTFSTTNSTISRTSLGNTVVIAKGIVSFRVELIDEMTIEYSIQSSIDDINLRSSVTLREFDRPSPAS